MRGWWNQGLHEKGLSTYCFLVRCNIPQRLSLFRIRNWQDNIHEMLGRIPLFTSEDTNTWRGNIIPRRTPTISTEILSTHFGSIDSKITLYEQILRDAPTLLELAIWKSKITERYAQHTEYSATNVRKRRRIDSVSNVINIVPNVLSFL